MVEKLNKKICVRTMGVAAFLVIAPSVALAPSITVSANTGVAPPRQVDASPSPSSRPAEQIAMASAVALRSVRDVVSRDLKIKSGDTLMKIALEAGVGRAQAHEAVTALSKIFDPRRLIPGQTLTLTYLPKETKDDDVSLEGIRLQANAYQGYEVRRGAGDRYVPRKLVKDLETRLVRATGVIDSNLYLAATDANIPPGIMLDLVRVYSWDVDFQRDIQPGDRFDVVYEQVYTVDGAHVRDGDILYSRLVLSGASLPLYRYEYAKGRTDYFDDKGQSARKPLLRTPVDGARLSSRFGRRRHPALGYTRMHRGVDFAAPSGTPIYAAGDGTIVARGRNGGYGRYIRIRHNREYSTAYAHMRAYRSGLGAGSRVKQGQVIGYVGSSGLSTGPHLHFEVLVRNHQVNPLRVRLPSGRKLRGKQLARFQAALHEMDQRIAQMPARAELASD